MPASPKLIKDDTVEAGLWDDLVKEATRGFTPWRKRLPDGQVLEVAECPTSDVMEEVMAAQARGDNAAAMTALFGAEIAPTLLDLTAGQPFTVRALLINGVFKHYGMSLADAPES